MNERNLIPEAIEYLSKSDEERILFCKKDHWTAYRDWETDRKSVV